MMDIAVIGAGSWGTTLAMLASRNAKEVSLWAHDSTLADEMQKVRENRKYLPDRKIPDNVTITKDMRAAVRGCKVILAVVPTAFMRGVIREFAPFILPDAAIINASKGFEPDTRKRMSEVLREELPGRVICALTGPNHAEEVSKNIPAATVLAGDDKKRLKSIAALLTTENFKVFSHDDIVGVEVCGSLKNITALAAGACDGLGLGDNAKGAIITLGLSEMNTVGRLYEAKRATCYGLAGVGDLVATCTSRHSRNRRAGEFIAKGLTIDQISKEMRGMIAEGIYSTKAAYSIGQECRLDLPLTKTAYNVIYQKKDIHLAIRDLLTAVQKLAERR